MAWIILFAAGLFEIAWVVGLKYSHGFTRLTPSILTVIAMVISLVLLAQAMKTLPMGTAYAIWTGIGAIGATILGIYLFKEPASAVRLISLSLIIVGIVGLKLSQH